MVQHCYVEHFCHLKKSVIISKFLLCFFLQPNKTFLVQNQVLHIAHKSIIVIEGFRTLFSQMLKRKKHKSNFKQNCKQKLTH